MFFPFQKKFVSLLLQVVALLMYEFSAIDGFVEITESLGDMIKYLANEPSVGLYYIQQHAQNAAPNIIHLKNNITETSHESILHAEDLEDSITAVRSMQECGFPIAEGMIGDIKKSLSIMSTKQPIRGLIQPTSSSFWTGTSSSSSSWSPATWSRSSVNILKTAKQKAGNLKWPPLDLRELREFRGEKDETTSINEPPESDSAVEFEEDRRSYGYDNFKADREAKLEEWLKEIGNMDYQERIGETERL